MTPQQEQLLTSVLNLLNQILQNGKTVDELPAQNSIVPASKLHVFRNGTSERVTIQQIIDACSSTPNNQIVSLSEISIVGNVVTIPECQWTISGLFYSKNTPTEFTVNYCGTGKTRIDLIYATTTGEILIIEGTETAGIAVRPVQPLNTVIVTEITVSDTEINSVLPLLTPDIVNALISAANPSASNPFATESFVLENAGGGGSAGTQTYDEVLTEGNETGVTAIHTDGTNYLYLSPESVRVTNTDTPEFEKLFDKLGLTFKKLGTGGYEKLLSPNNNGSKLQYDGDDLATEGAVVSALAPLADDISVLTTNMGNKADLVDGLIPSSQLPGFVDDVLEYNNLAAFPATGESGKIYVDKTTNKSYRWSGSAYVALDEGVVLGETSSTAYRGDRGKVAYEHSQDTSVHVTSGEKSTWNSKQNGFTIIDYSNLTTVSGLSSITICQVFVVQCGLFDLIFYTIQGVSNASSFSFTVPNNNHATKVSYGDCRVQNSGSYSSTPGYAQINVSSNVVNLYASLSGTGAFGTSGNKTAIGTLIQLIQ